MNSRYRSYTVYGIGVGMVWAVLLLVASRSDSDSKRDNIAMVFEGFAIGWLSATIARFVYPPPKKYRPKAGQLS